MKLLLALLLLMTTLIGYAHPSVSIVMDSKGNVYYSDLTQVWRIDTQGKKSVIVQKVHTHELFLDADDNLYGEHLWYNGEAANTWGHYVWRLSAGGKLEKIMPDREGFLTDYSFVRDQQGRMYWADRETDCQKVVRKNKDGSHTKLGDQCMTNIRWMISASDGTIYLTDFHDLKKIDPEGHVTILAEKLAEKKLTVLFVNEAHYLCGVNTDKAENIYVSDFSGRQVKKITPFGKISVAAETSIPWSPSGTLVASNGDFWILEYSVTNAVRVERITTQGRRIIY